MILIAHVDRSVRESSRTALVGKAASITMADPVVDNNLAYERVDEDGVDLSSPRFTKIAEAVRCRFGFSIKDYQALVVPDILDKKHDVFVIAGTGSGKSLIYQVLPILLSQPIVLVVCPTLSLMGDQVLRFTRLGIRAVALTAQNIAENKGLWKEVQDEKFDLVLASPETLLREGSYFWDNILRNKKSAFCIRLYAIVIDECHLVWGWRQFRKDYLGLGTMRAHFPNTTMIAMSATVTPNVLRFVANTIGLRPGFRLYKQSIDRVNIAQFVCQISRDNGYTQLLPLLIGTGATWTIPKTMIFVDSIDNATTITGFLRKSVPDHQQGYTRQLVRPFHASLDSFLRDEYLESFREGDCRILVCTDAAGMSVDIPDIQVVIQWGISEHLTLATLWQRIGRAGRDPNINALAITFAHERHILPLAIPEDSAWYGFDHPVEHLDAQRTKDFISRIYERTQADQRSRFSAPTSYHKVDPLVLWYINTSGCWARSVMASFLDSTAYSVTRPVKECCDNCLYNLAAQTGTQLPDFSRHRFDVSISTQYLQSEVYKDMQVDNAIRLAEERTSHDAIRSTRLQHIAVKHALDIYALEKYNRLHRRLFPPSAHEKLAEGCACIVDRASMERELDNPRFCLRESALHTHVDSLIDLITTTLLNSADEGDLGELDTQVNDLAGEGTMSLTSVKQPPNILETISHTGRILLPMHSLPHINEHTSMDCGPGPAWQPTGISLFDNTQVPISPLMEVVSIPTEALFDNTSRPISPLIEVTSRPTEALIPPPIVDTRPSKARTTHLPQGPQRPTVLALPIVATSETLTPSGPSPLLQAEPQLVDPPIPIKVPQISQTHASIQPKIPSTLPVGITLEKYLSAQLELMGKMTLVSDFATNPPGPSTGNLKSNEVGDSKTDSARLPQEPCTNGASRSALTLETKKDTRKRKRNPVETARNKVEAQASQVEKTKVKRAMRETTKVALCKKNKQAPNETEPLA